MQKSQIKESFRDYEGFCRASNIEPTYDGYKVWIASNLKD